MNDMTIGRRSLLRASACGLLGLGLSTKFPAWAQSGSHGLRADTPVLIAANVSLPDETQISTRLDLLPLAVKLIGADSPTIFIIGHAVAAADRPAAQPGIVSARSATPTRASSIPG